MSKKLTTEEFVKRASKRHGDVPNIKWGQIYLTSNKINGRKYVGQTTRKKYSKWYLGSGVLIKKAIKKHGNENFCKIILWEGYTTANELNNLEIKYIKLHNTKVHLGGYNLASGGNSNSGYKASNSTRKKISKSKNAMNFKHTEETKKLISKRIKQAIRLNGSKKKELSLQKKQERKYLKLELA